MTEEADAVATDPIVYVEGMYGETSLKTKMEDKEGAPRFILLKEGDPEVTISVDMFESLTDEQRTALLVEYDLEM